MEEEHGMIPYLEETYDMVIIGTGHVGCEAVLVSTRLGMETVVFTVSVDSIALMPYNPNIGGSSKGHPIRELDALDGETGKNINKTFIQSRMLNESEGPTIHSLRAQIDKQDYSRHVGRTPENAEHFATHQAEVSEIMAEDDKIRGVETFSGAVYYAKAVTLCTGTHLKARRIHGDVSSPTGPSGFQAANHLTDSLREYGIEMFWFEIGTPARVGKKNIDFSRMEGQLGDPRIVPFSSLTNPDETQEDQVSCWLAYTNENIYHIIKGNLDRSPLFSGTTKGTGPRCCPSIGDKVVKFPDENCHQVFMGPEGLHTNGMCLGGMSSSLPEDVQYVVYRTVPGLEKVKIVRSAYTIEHDCINALQFRPILELKRISGLSTGGQFSGSSGYEEAIVQGFMTGVNVVMKIRGQEAMVLDRPQTYIGVLVGDLVTKGGHEPYRMVTSRVEYRLLLRQDNANTRLRRIGHEIGLVCDEEYEYLLRKMDGIQSEIRRLGKTVVGVSDQVQMFLESYGSTLSKPGMTLAELVKRPGLDCAELAKLDEGRPELPDDVREQVNTEIKYEGYIKCQTQQVAQFKKLGDKKLPEDFDYSEINSLHRGAAQKLNKVQPATIG